jgi:alkylation response protein AidB-like acyl-CoA dehydrogenase
MKIGYSAEDEAFRAELRAWFEEHYPRFRAEWVVSTVPSDLRWRRAWEDYVCQAGWSGLDWPLAYGGKAWPLTRLAIFHEEQARIGAPLGVNIIAHGILGPTLIHFASEAQRCRFLPGILSNREVWCQGYSEASAGSDLASLRTRAVRHGDHYVLTGSKIWTSFAQVADFCFVLARTDPGAQRHKGISFFLVDMKSAGVRVEPIRQITGEQDFNEVIFDDVELPLDSLVGEENAGWRIAMAAANFERGTYFIPRQVRFARELQSLAELARTGAAGADNGQRTAVAPAVQRELVRLACDSHVLRLKSYRALTHALRGLPPGPEGAATKLHWSEAHQRLLGLAMDLLGERALAGPAGHADPLASHWVRDYLWSRAETILAGTSEVQRNIIAEQLLGMPKA